VSYDYTISTAFPNAKVAPDRLTSEIQASSITVAIDNISTVGDTCAVSFKAALSAGEQTTLAALVAAHSGVALADAATNVVVSMPVTSDGRLRVAGEKSDAAKKTIISHDWTDKTTWCEAAVRVVDEVASVDTPYTVYALAHTNVIDSYHGKFSQEDFMLDAAGYSYRAVVKVNDVAKTEQDPHYGTGGDYTVNYATGKVTFLSALQSTDVVKVTYHYATSSVFTIKPEAGKALKLEFAEVQFSADVVLTDSVVFQPYGLVDVFAPQLMPGVPSGTKIPLGNPVIYKSVSDFQNDAVKAYPVYPVLGGSGWRGSPQPTIIFDWDYVSSTLLRSDYGMEIRLSLQHDEPFGGWFATSTLYCLSEALS
jgi:hypothetical protein